MKAKSLGREGKEKPNGKQLGWRGLLHDTSDVYIFFLWLNCKTILIYVILFYNITKFYIRYTLKNLTRVITLDTWLLRVGLQVLNLIVIILL